MRGKKGAGHFEMIVGFVFFIGFVFFMFLFISPWDNSALPKSALGKLYNSFSENVSVPLSSVFVSANYAGSASCFYIKLPYDLFSEQDIRDESSRVTRLGGTPIISDISGENLFLSQDETHFRVAISPEFQNSTATCIDELTDFELGGVVEIKVVSNKSLTKMKDLYYSDYDALKRSLRVADNFDFAIVPESMPEFVMKPENGPPNVVEVLARDYVVKVLTSNGAISNERISFRIW